MLQQVLRNIGGINPDSSQRMSFKHGKNAQFAGPGIAKTMINQGVRVYEVAFWVSSGRWLFTTWCDSKFV